MGGKIKPYHLARKAMLYVRQSSPSQLERNPESRRLQYGMKKRLVDLGWPRLITGYALDALSRQRAKPGTFNSTKPPQPRLDERTVSAESVLPWSRLSDIVL